MEIRLPPNADLGLDRGTVAATFRPPPSVVVSASTSPHYSKMMCISPFGPFTNEDLFRIADLSAHKARGRRLESSLR